MTNLDPGRGIEFEEDKWRTPVPNFNEPTPKMVQWVSKISGLDERQSQYFLLSVSALILVVVVFMFFTGGTKIEPNNIYDPNDPKFTSGPS